MRHTSQQPSSRLNKNAPLWSGTWCLPSHHLGNFHMPPMSMQDVCRLPQQQRSMAVVCMRGLFYLAGSSALHACCCGKIILFFIHRTARAPAPGFRLSLRTPSLVRSLRLRHLTYPANLLKDVSKPPYLSLDATPGQHARHCARVWRARHNVQRRVRLATYLSLPWYDVTRWARILPAQPAENDNARRQQHTYRLARTARRNAASRRCSRATFRFAARWHNTAHARFARG